MHPPFNGKSCEYFLACDKLKLVPKQKDLGLIAEVVLTSRERKTQMTELARQVPASTGPWRAKWRILSHFLTSIVPKQQFEGDLLGNFCFEKSLNAEKKLTGGPLVSPGFGTIKFCRTFKNYFGQFVWIERKVNTIVAFHFMKRRLKMA